VDFSNGFKNQILLEDYKHKYDEDADLKDF